MAKTPAKPKPDGFDMFCFASLYHDAARVIGEYYWNRHCPMDEKLGRRVIDKSQAHFLGLMIPASVLFAFSLELSLKCLMRVRGRFPARGHDTEALFAKLSQNDQLLVCKKYRQVTGHKRPRDAMRSILTRSKEYFANMRYGYELPAPRMPTDGNIRGSSGFAEAAAAVQTVILEKHPDWEQKYLARSSFV